MKFYILYSALLTGILMLNTAKAVDNVHFSGALVAEPCTLPDVDNDIHVEFGTVIVKYLYEYQRTKSQLFTIHLQNCDPSVMKTVNVTFEGAADEELTSMLALDPSSSAKGIAIGLSMADGASLGINESSQNQILINGNNDLEFNAYIQARPTAMSAKTIVVGDFDATATFKLTYQ